MNQSESRTTRYAAAGVGALVLLLVIGWFVVREEPPPPTEQPPARVVNAAPRERSVAPLFTAPDEEAARETPTNQVAESATANTNAAVIYGQAFALFNALSKEEKGLITDWRTNVDAATEAELCEKLQPICDLMHQAATVSNCDWGVEQPIMPETRLPYLSPSRNLARAGVWSATHCRKSDPSAAIDDLVATSQLGQKVTSPAILIGHLVHMAIQGTVIDSVAEHASVLLRTGDTRLADLFNNDNFDEGLRGAFVAEADMLKRQIDRLAALPPEDAMRELTQIADDSNPKIQSTDMAQAFADLRQAAELQQQYAQALDLPEAEYRQWQSRVDEIGKSNPFVESFVTGLGKAVDRTQAMTVRSAMATAGLAVLQDGPAALQTNPDPTTGQPFAYTQTADGFELQSSFQFQEKPVKLTFK